MASDVLTLFNMPSSREIGMNYLDSQMTSPQQQASQGLLQQVVSMGGNAGASLGYAGGRLLGGQAPQEARARGIEEAMAKVQGLGLKDDAEMYSALAQELGARGLSQDAMQAAQAARKVQAAQSQMKLEAAKTTKAEAEAEAALREKRVNAQSTVGKLQADRAAAQAAGASSDVLAAYDKAIAAEGTSKGSTTVIQGLDKVITAATGKAVGEEIASLGKNLSTLPKFERSVKEVADLLPNSFTGTGADIMTSMNKLATAAGLSAGTKASNTEILTNTFNNIVLPMARQLPGSLAAKELTFLLTTKPAIQQEPATIRRLMKQMLEDYQVDAQTYNAAQAHFTKNKSYEGFDVNQARYSIGQKMNTQNEMSSLEQAVKNKTATLEQAQRLLQLRGQKND